MTLTTGAVLLYSSVYAPSEQENIDAANRRKLKSSASKSDFKEFFSKMKNANDPEQQKVFQGT